VPTQSSFHFSQCYIVQVLDQLGLFATFCGPILYIVFIIIIT